VEKYKGLVLVVDDEVVVQEALCRILQRELYTCTAVSSGEVALEKTAVQEFDVVLLDLLMPGLSGMDVLRRLARRQPRTQVIIVTSALDSDTVREAIALGAFDYVTKPFNTHDLLARVAKAVAKKRGLDAGGGQKA
jgi:DNA-binding response OmpR family regulator